MKCVGNFYEEITNSNKFITYQQWVIKESCLFISNKLINNDTRKMWFNYV